MTPASTGGLSRGCCAEWAADERPDCVDWLWFVSASRLLREDGMTRGFDWGRHEGLYYVQITFLRTKTGSVAGQTSINPTRRGRLMTEEKSSSPDVKRRDRRSTKVF
jgi:hypothetical protein